jgi:hypothetical protein
VLTFPLLVALEDAVLQLADPNSCTHMWHFNCCCSFAHVAGMLLLLLLLYNVKAATT